MRQFVLAMSAVLGALLSGEFASAQGQPQNYSISKGRPVEVSTPEWALWRRFHETADTWSGTSVTEGETEPTEPIPLALSAAQLQEIIRFGEVYSQALASLESQHRQQVASVERSGMPEDLFRALQESRQKGGGSPEARDTSRRWNSTSTSGITRTTMEQNRAQRSKLIESFDKRFNAALEDHKTSLRKSMGSEVLSAIDAWIAANLGGKVKMFRIETSSALSPQGK